MFSIFVALLIAVTMIGAAIWSSRSDLRWLA